MKSNEKSVKSEIIFAINLIYWDERALYSVYFSIRWQRVHQSSAIRQQNARDLY